MHDLSLYLLELLENALRAQATQIEVELFVDRASDTLRLCVEDNGMGLPASPEEVVQPFYTTKKNKATGLGLSLLKADAEACGGHLYIGKSSSLGGTKVEAEMKLSHVDRPPIGDVGTTLVVAAVTNPQAQITVTLGGDCISCPCRNLPLAQAKSQLEQLASLEKVVNQKS